MPAAQKQGKPATDESVCNDRKVLTALSDSENQGL
jgi:hypothetical protein